MRSLAVLLVLTATAAADPELSPAIGVTVSATSTLKSKGKTYEPWYALGGDPTRFWCEGSPDDGIGDALTLRFATPTRVTSVRIRAGVWRSPELFHANNRITELHVISDDGRDKKVTLREERENVDVEIGRGAISELRFQIGAVAKGKMNDTCISGLEIETDPHAALVLGADGTAMAALQPTFAKVYKAFATCDEKVLRAQLKFPFVLKVNDRRDRRFGDAAAVKKACKAGDFKSFVDAGGAVKVASPAPMTVALDADVFAWRFVLAGGAWQLTALEDATP